MKGRSRARAALHEHGDARPPLPAQAAHMPIRAGVDVRVPPPDGARQAGPARGGQEAVGSMRPVPDAVEALAGDGVHI